MKKALFILAVLIIFTSYQSYAKGSGDWLQGTKKSEVTINLTGLEKLALGGTWVGHQPPEQHPSGQQPGQVEPGRTTPPTPVNLSSRMTVNSEIADLETNKLDGLDYFVSRAFTLRIDDQNRSTNYDKNERMLVISENVKTSNPWIFEVNNAGVYRYHEKNNFFLIKFKPDDQREASLRFIKNTQLNCYVLDSVIINDIPYPIRNVKEGHINLLVAGEDNRNTEIPAGITSSQGRTFTHEEKMYYDERESSPPRERSQSISNNIIASGSVNTDGVIRYIRSRNRTPVYSESEIRNLVNTYIREADREGVNHDLAIAQMIHVTDFFKNDKIKSTNNYAGLNREGTRWSGSFPNMQEGVRAHIQHLRIYARPSLKNPEDCVNPRHNLIANRERLQTFNQLYSRWQPNHSDRYARNINEILEGMYSFSGR